MNYGLEIHYAVGDDLENGRLSYEQLRQGLGDELFAEVYSTMTRLQDNPLLFQKRYGEFRIVVTKRFQYKIVYRVEEEKVYVIAVSHPRQHPTAWMERIE
ncbi:ParE toxin of type II toxin-antitoxin system, parDE [Alkalispirochaeta americana]|uniref:ParE toxin of type II toxin-antitoxin system, parDE n=1 Tax=Alkalispirochaeta americana TaxID=159291 RepID=A0A1N6YDT1_9SPIO|nr:ParE toxin of type II toxin-antitoxin system, parDE [Alkalispirochaeta americana]